MQRLRSPAGGICSGWEGWRAAGSRPARPGLWGDETGRKGRGKARPVGMVVAPDGRRIGLELTGPGFD